MTLSTPIGKIPRIGPVYLKKLQKMGIKTIEDLFFHFPHRYEDFSNIIPISQVKLNETCSVQGKIIGIENSRTWKKKMFLTDAIIEDESGAIKATWFNQPYLTKSLKSGDNICLAGKLVFSDNSVHLSNPAYEKIAINYKLKTTNYKLTHTGRIIPVYPETEGLSSKWFRYILKPLLTAFKNNILEILPNEIIQEEQLLPINQAIWQIHFPDSMELAQKAQERFSFQELFLIELTVLRERMKLNQQNAVEIPMDVELVKRLVGYLPFKLTDGQKKSAWQILKDMEKPRPMNRLLEGDVGSGKTVVALIAALTAIKQGHQVAFMAPTEILAKQHFHETALRLKDFNINIGLLTGKEDKYISKKLKQEPIEISRKKLLEKTLKGEINILIGTHTLIQDKVKFSPPPGGGLALVILDEQHRFGVEQRAKLTRKPKASRYSEQKIYIPHLLSMTATPIPRTLALTVYGDLDLSLIDALPKERKKIITKVIAPTDRTKAYDFIRKQIEKGKQAFVIYPRIESQKLKDKTQNQNLQGKTKDMSSWANVKAVEDGYEELSKKIFPDLRIEMLHGKMATKEKERIMKKFKNGKIDILVSTSVIEVGIDIPNATVILIEGAERFGLAQLHQFRGRVGRAHAQSFCFLFTDSHSKKTRQRLRALISAENGFELAEKDLKIRGPGDFSGARQWGIPDLAMEALTNISLVEKTREAAKEILTADPQLKKHPLLQERMKKFREKIHLE